MSSSEEAYSSEAYDTGHLSLDEQIAKIRQSLGMDLPFASDSYINTDNGSPTFFSPESGESTDTVTQISPGDVNMSSLDSGSPWPSFSSSYLDNLPDIEKLLNDSEQLAKYANTAFEDNIAGREAIVFPYKFDIPLSSHQEDTTIPSPSLKSATTSQPAAHKGPILTAATYSPSHSDEFTQTLSDDGMDVFEREMQKIGVGSVEEEAMDFRDIGHLGAEEIDVGAGIRSGMGAQIDMGADVATGVGANDVYDYTTGIDNGFATGTDLDHSYTTDMDIDAKYHGADHQKELRTLMSSPLLDDTPDIPELYDSLDMEEVQRREDMMVNVATLAHMVHMHGVTDMEDLGVACSSMKGKHGCMAGCTCEECSEPHTVSPTVGKKFPENQTSSGLSGNSQSSTQNQNKEVIIKIIHELPSTMASSTSSPLPSAPTFSSSSSSSSPASSSSSSSSSSLLSPAPYETISTPTTPTHSTPIFPSAVPTGSTPLSSISSSSIPASTITADSITPATPPPRVPASVHASTAASSSIPTNIDVTPPSVSTSSASTPAASALVTTVTTVTTTTAAPSISSFPTTTTTTTAAASPSTSNPASSSSVANPIPATHTSTSTSPMAPTTASDISPDAGSSAAPVTTLATTTPPPTSPPISATSAPTSVTTHTVPAATSTSSLSTSILPMTRPVAVAAVDPALLTTAFLVSPSQHLRSSTSTSTSSLSSLVPDSSLSATLPSLPSSSAPSSNQCTSCADAICRASDAVTRALYLESTLTEARSMHAASERAQQRLEEKYEREKQGLLQEISELHGKLSAQRDKIAKHAVGDVSEYEIGDVFIQVFDQEQQQHRKMTIDELKLHYTTIHAQYLQLTSQLQVASQEKDSFLRKEQELRSLLAESWTRAQEQVQHIRENIEKGYISSLQDSKERTDATYQVLSEMQQQMEKRVKTEVENAVLATERKYEEEIGRYKALAEQMKEIAYSKSNDTAAQVQQAMEKMEKSWEKRLQDERQFSQNEISRYQELCSSLREENTNLSRECKTIEKQYLESVSENAVLRAEKSESHGRVMVLEDVCANHKAHALASEEHVSRLTQRLQALEQDKDALIRDLEEKYRHSVELSISQYNTRVQTLEKSHEKHVRELEKEYEDRVATQQQLYTDKLAITKEGYEMQLKSLREEQEKKMELYMVENKDKVSRLQHLLEEHRRVAMDKEEKVFKEHQYTIQSLETRFRNEIQDITEKYEDKLKSQRDYHEEKYNMLVSKYEQQLAGMDEIHRERLEVTKSHAENTIQSLESEQNLTYQKLRLTKEDIERREIGKRRREREVWRRERAEIIEVKEREKRQISENWEKKVEEARKICDSLRLEVQEERSKALELIREAREGRDQAIERQFAVIQERDVAVSEVQRQSETYREKLKAFEVQIGVLEQEKGRLMQMLQEKDQIHEVLVAKLEKEVLENKNQYKAYQEMEKNERQEIQKLMLEKEKEYRQQSDVHSQQVLSLLQQEHEKMMGRIHHLEAKLAEERQVHQEALQRASETLESQLSVWVSEKDREGGLEKRLRELSEHCKQQIKDVKRQYKERNRLLEEQADARVEEKERAMERKVEEVKEKHKSKLRQAEEEMRERIEAVEAQCRARVDKVEKDTRAALEKGEREYKEMKASLEGGYTLRLSACEEQIRTLQEEKGVCEERLRQQETTWQTRLSCELEKKKMEYEHKISVLQQEKETLKGQLERELSVLRERYTHVEASSDRWQKEYEDVNAMYLSCREENGKLSQDLEQLYEDFSRIEEDNLRFKQNTEELEGKMATLKQNFLDLQRLSQENSQKWQKERELLIQTHSSSLYTMEKEYEEQLSLLSQTYTRDIDALRSELTQVQENKEKALGQLQRSKEEELAALEKAMQEQLRQMEERSIDEEEEKQREHEVKLRELEEKYACDMLMVEGMYEEKMSVLETRIYEGEEEMKVMKERLESEVAELRGYYEDIMDDLRSKMEDLEKSVSVLKAENEKYLEQLEDDAKKYEDGKHNALLSLQQEYNAKMNELKEELSVLQKKHLHDMNVYQSTYQSSLAQIKKNDEELLQMVKKTHDEYMTAMVDSHKKEMNELIQKHNMVMDEVHGKHRDEIAVYREKLIQHEENQKKVEEKWMSTVEKMKTELQMKVEECQELENRYLLKSCQYDNLNDNIVEVKKNLSEWKKKATEAEVRLHDMMQQCSAIDTSNANYKGKHELLQQEYERMREEYGNVCENRDNYREMAGDLRMQVQKYELLIESMSKEASTIQTSLSSLTEQHKQQSARVSELTDTLTLTQSLLHDCEERERRVMQEKDKLGLEYVEKEEEHMRVLTRYEELEQRNHVLTQRIEEWKGKHANMKEIMHVLEGECGEYKEMCLQYEEKVKQLEEEWEERTYELKEEYEDKIREIEEAFEEQYSRYKENHDSSLQSMQVEYEEIKKKLQLCEEEQGRLLSLLETREQELTDVKQKMDIVVEEKERKEREYMVKLADLEGKKNDLQQSLEKLQLELETRYEAVTNDHELKKKDMGEYIDILRKQIYVRDQENCKYQEKIQDSEKVVLSQLEIISGLEEQIRVGKQVVLAKEVEIEDTKKELAEKESMIKQKGEEKDEKEKELNDMTRLLHQLQVDKERDMAMYKEVLNVEMKKNEEETRRYNELLQTLSEIQQKSADVSQQYTTMTMKYEEEVEKCAKLQSEWAESRQKVLSLSLQLENCENKVKMQQDYAQHWEKRALDTETRLSGVLQEHATSLREMREDWTRQQQQQQAGARTSPLASTVIHSLCSRPTHICDKAYAAMEELIVVKGEFELQKALVQRQAAEIEKQVSEVEKQAKEVEKHKGEVTRQEEMLREQARVCETLRQRCEEIEGAKVEVKNKYEEDMKMCMSEKMRFEAEKSRLEREKDALEREIRVFSGIQEKYEEQLLKLRTQEEELVDVNKELTKCKSQLSVYMQECESYAEERKVMQARIEEMENEYLLLQNERQLSQNELLSQREAELRELQGKLKVKEEEVAGYVYAIDEYESKIGDIERLVHEKESEYHDLLRRKQEALNTCTRQLQDMSVEHEISLNNARILHEKEMLLLKQQYESRVSTSGETDDSARELEKKYEGMILNLEANHTETIVRLRQQFQHSIEAVEGNYDVLRKQYEEKKKENRDLVSSLEEEHEELKKNMGKYRVLEQKYEEVNVLLEKEREKSSLVSKDATRMEEELKVMRVELLSMRDERGQQQARLLATEEECRQLQLRMNTIIKEKEAIVRENNALEEEKRALLKEQSSLLAAKENLSAQNMTILKEKEAILTEKEKIVADKETIARENEELRQEKERIFTKMQALRDTFEDKVKKIQYERGVYMRECETALETKAEVQQELELVKQQLDKQLDNVMLLEKEVYEKGLLIVEKEKIILEREKLLQSEESDKTTLNNTLKDKNAEIHSLLQSLEEYEHRIKLADQEIADITYQKTQLTQETVSRDRIIKETEQRLANLELSSTALKQKLRRTIIDRDRAVAVLSLHGLLESITFEELDISRHVPEDWVQNTSIPNSPFPSHNFGKSPIRNMSSGNGLSGLKTPKSALKPTVSSRRVPSSLTWSDPYTDSSSNYSNDDDNNFSNDDNNQNTGGLSIGHQRGGVGATNDDNDGVDMDLGLGMRLSDEDSGAHLHNVSVRANAHGYLTIPHNNAHTHASSIGSHTQAPNEQDLGRREQQSEDEEMSYYGDHDEDSHHYSILSPAYPSSPLPPLPRAPQPSRPTHANANTTSSSSASASPVRDGNSHIDNRFPHRKTLGNVASPSNIARHATAPVQTPSEEQLLDQLQHLEDKYDQLYHEFLMLHELLLASERNHPLAHTHSDIRSQAPSHVHGDATTADFGASIHTNTLEDIDMDESLPDHVYSADNTFIGTGAHISTSMGTDDMGISPDSNNAASVGNDVYGMNEDELGVNVLARVRRMLHHLRATEAETAALRAAHAHVRREHSLRVVECARLERDVEEKEKEYEKLLGAYRVVCKQMEEMHGQMRARDKEIEEKDQLLMERDALLVQIMRDNEELARHKVKMMMNRDDTVGEWEEEEEVDGGQKLNIWPSEKEKDQEDEGQMEISSKTSDTGSVVNISGEKLDSNSQGVATETPQTLAPGRTRAAADSVILATPSHIGRQEGALTTSVGAGHGDIATMTSTHTSTTPAAAAATVEAVVSAVGNDYVDSDTTMMSTVIGTSSKLSSASGIRNKLFSPSSLPAFPNRFSPLKPLPPIPSLSSSSSTSSTSTPSTSTTSTIPGSSSAYPTSSADATTTISNTTTGNDMAHTSSYSQLPSSPSSASIMSPHDVSSDAHTHVSSLPLHSRFPTFSTPQHTSAPQARRQASITNHHTHASSPQHAHTRPQRQGVAFREWQSVSYQEQPDTHSTQESGKTDPDYSDDSEISGIQEESMRVFIPSSMSTHHTSVRTTHPPTTETTTNIGTGSGAGAGAGAGAGVGAGMLNTSSSSLSSGTMALVNRLLREEGVDADTVSQVGDSTVEYLLHKVSGGVSPYQNTPQPE